MSVRCRSCKAEILWAVNAKSGKAEPLDAEPVANGNIEIVEWEDALDDDHRRFPKIRHLLKGEAESATLLETPPRYLSHFATCPNASMHRANSQASTKGST